MSFEMKTYRAQGEINLELTKQLCRIYVVVQNCILNCTECFEWFLKVATILVINDEIEPNN